MSPSGIPPPAEVEIDRDLVRRLLSEQHADLSDLELRRAAEGWDNVTFRLGEDRAVRLPRRAAAAPLILHEQRWLPTLAPHLPIPIPAPTRTGTAADTYPWAWSVVPWVPGDTALHAPLAASEAGVLGSFLSTLHGLPVPSDAPPNPFRGVPLRGRLEGLDTRMARLRGDTIADLVDLELVTDVIRVGADQPMSRNPTWLHGDLHAKNVVQRDGRIVAVVDFGDINAGDPATDLAAVWALFDKAYHEQFWKAYGQPDEATRVRARAWAAAFGTMIWEAHHQDDPAFAAAGLQTLRRLAQSGPDSGDRRP